MRTIRLQKTARFHHILAVCAVLFCSSCSSEILYLPESWGKRFIDQDGVRYTVSGTPDARTAYVSGYDTSYEKEVVSIVSEFYDGDQLYHVTHITKQAFANASSIRCIIFDNFGGHIDSEAFSLCPNLARIRLHGLQAPTFQPDAFSELQYEYTVVEADATIDDCDWEAAFRTVLHGR